MPEVFERGNKRITLIDLSDCLENATSAFEPNQHTIEYMTPEESAAAAEQRFGLPSSFWPDGLGWAVERVTLSTHSGTHIDAPAHYGPAHDGQARTIDQVPLRWCFSDGVVLNMTHKKRGEGIILPIFYNTHQSSSATIISRNASRSVLIAKQIRRKTMTVKPVREGFHTVTPYLIVQEAARLINFVKEAFGATEHLRGTGSAGGIHAEVRIGDSMVMIGGDGAWSGESSPATLYLYVDDVDAVYKRALQAGATSIMEPANQPYGDRLGGVKDAFGNTWYISTHVEDVQL